MGIFSDVLGSHEPLQKRANFSKDLLQKIQTKLTDSSICNRPDLCIYAAGSLARHETGRESDLDLFFISRGDPKSENSRTISRLGEIQIFSDLIRLNEELSLDPFSGDGKYLKIHELKNIIDGTGSSEDDSENLFTTRLLLLLESKMLAGQLVYSSAVELVLENYFRDGRGRKDFRPLFLLNDILRYWRTLCLNYERDRAQPDKPWWKRNLNLKFPRKLTVFSTVLAMIATRMSTANEFAAISAMTPMERLAYALDTMNDPEFEAAFASTLDDYEFFLAAKSHRDLEEPTPAQLGDYSERAQRFDQFFQAVFASPKLERRLVQYVLI